MPFVARPPRVEPGVAARVRLPAGVALNFPPSSATSASGDEPVRALLDRGFRSAVLEHEPSVTRGTMNAFRHEDGGRARIDHVLVRGPLEVLDAAILGGRVDGLFPSDHDAVTAVVAPTP